MMLLHELARTIEHHSEALLAVSIRALASIEGRVSPSQLRALLLLEAGGGMNLGTLAGALGVGAPSASRLVDRLVAAGYVHRAVAPRSRREIEITINARGRRILAQLRQRRRRDIAAVLEQMRASDRQDLARGLAAFAATSAEDEVALAANR